MYVRPGQFVNLRAEVGNTGDTVEEGFLIVKFREIPGEESVQTIRLQPKETRIFDLCLGVPVSLAEKTKVHIQATLCRIEGGREVILDLDGQPMIDTLELPVNSELVVAAAAFDPSPPQPMHWVWPTDTLHETYEIYAAARVDSRLSRRVIEVERNMLPLEINKWDLLDCLMIADAEVLQDGSTLHALKRWLLDGGNCWILIDRIPTELVRTLLASNQQCETVDEIALNSFSVDVKSQTSISDEDRMVDSDHPIRLKRVLQQGGDVTHSIDGWPVAIWMTIGNGKLLLTTLAPRAWIAPRTQQENRDEERKTTYGIPQWGQNLAMSFNISKVQRSIHSKEFEYPMRQLGNPVVSKSLIQMTLLVFLIALGSMGFHFWRTQELLRMGGWGPLVAIAACLPPIIASLQVQRNAPDSIGRLQLIELTPDGNSATIREKSAIYLQSSKSMQLTTEVDALIEAKATGGDVGIQRWSWQDFHRWSISNNSWPAGLWRVDTRYTLPAEGLRIIGDVDEQGFHWSLPPSVATLSDPILSYVPGNPGLCNHLGGTRWRLEESQSARSGRWISDTLMNDEQVRRSDVYQTVIGEETKGKSPGYPALYGWVPLWKGGPQWDAQLSERGHALIAMPIFLKRPIVGASVHIPHQLIQLYALDSVGSQSLAFNNRTGRWAEDSTAARKIEIRASIPLELLPLKVSSIEVEMHIKAPRRPVRVAIKKEGKEIELAKLQSPTLSWSQRITDSEFLEMAQTGIVPFIVEVGEPGSDTKDPNDLGKQSLESAVGWHMEYFHVSFDGKTLPTSSLPEVSP